MTTRNAIIVFMIFVTSAMLVGAKKRSTPLMFVEYNCENLFDCHDDSLKNDQEFLPESKRQWTFGRYWKKVNDIGRVIQQCGETPGDEEDYHLPDLVSLCEVENDSALLMLTQRSILKGAGYKYVMTDSPDLRGIDVALLYNPLTFRLVDSHSLRIRTPEAYARHTVRQGFNPLCRHASHLYNTRSKPQKRAEAKRALPHQRCQPPAASH